MPDEIEHPSQRGKDDSAFDYGGTLPDGQHERHPTKEVSKTAFIRPLRHSYRHKCGIKTTMGDKIARTYAADPVFYQGTFCAGCRGYYPVGEFVWIDEETGKDTDEKVGS